VESASGWDWDPMLAMLLTSGGRLHTYIMIACDEQIILWVSALLFLEIGPFSVVLIGSAHLAS
jgi:hypothetical protein